MIQSISDYILFLKQICGLMVSIHPAAERETLISSSTLMRFNFHENSYCALIKQNPRARQHCTNCQKKVLNACSRGILDGVCFAGVREWVYPVTNGEQVTAFLSVSGYTTSNAESYFQRLSSQYGFPTGELQTAYRSLSPDFPKQQEIDTLLIPLCAMLELAYRKDCTPSPSLSFIQQVIRYVRQNHDQNITSQSICEHFSCSRCYMSTQFNRATGKTIRQYINDLRMDDAKALLQSTSLSVTDIAFTVGFASSNYFSALFRQAEGISPMRYRKMYTKQ